jgi:hypothetical protein
LVIFFILFLYATWHHSSIYEKDKYILNFLPKNFTLLKNHLLTREAVQIHIQYPIEKDEYFIKHKENLNKWKNNLIEFKKSGGYQMYVKSVEEKGYGVFANEFIPSDEIVGDYLGILTTTVYEDYKYSWSYLPSNSSYWDTPHEDLLLDGNFYGDGWLR